MADSSEWEWPIWALDGKSAGIEVFVEDEDVPGGGMWVPATPKNRVVDKDGYAAFLCAEYHWDDDGEDYIQDFPPDQVRRKGSKATVLDLVRQSSSETALREATSSQRLSSACPEIVLEPVFSAGMDLKGKHPRDAAIAFACSGPNLHATIGRQFQPQFFETVVQADKLLSVSRSHFELSWTGSGPVQLNRLTGNSMLVNGRKVAQGATTSVDEGGTIEFESSGEGQPPFFKLRLRIRNKAEVAAERSHPAVETTAIQARIGAEAVAGSSTVPITEGSSDAWLKCTSSHGANVSALPLASVGIPLSRGAALEIGRNKQPGFFEKLLQNQQQWLGYISRSHCRATLLGSTGSYQLTLENLSSNVIFINGRGLAKGARATIAEGGTLEFAAATDGKGSKIEKFLSFTLCQDPASYVSALRPAKGHA